MSSISGSRAQSKGSVMQSIGSGVKPKVVKSVGKKSFKVAITAGFAAVSNYPVNNAGKWASKRQIGEKSEGFGHDSELARRIGADKEKNVDNETKVTLESFAAMFRADEMGEGKKLKIYKNKGAVRFVAEKNGGVKIKKVANKFNLFGFGWLWRWNVRAEHNKALRNKLCDLMLEEWKCFKPDGANWSMESVGKEYGAGVVNSLGTLRASVLGQNASDEGKLLMRQDVKRAFAIRDSIASEKVVKDSAAAYLQNKIGRVPQFNTFDQFIGRYGDFVVPSKRTVRTKEGAELSFQMTNASAIKDYVWAAVQNRPEGKAFSEALKQALDDVGNALNGGFLASKADAELMKYVDTAASQEPLPQQENLNNVLRDFLTSPCMTQQIKQYMRELKSGNLKDFNMSSAVDDFIGQILLPGGGNKEHKTHMGLVHLVCSQMRAAVGGKITVGQAKEMLNLGNVVKLFKDYLSQYNPNLTDADLLDALLERENYLAMKWQTNSKTGNTAESRKIEAKIDQIHRQVLLLCRYNPNGFREPVKKFLSQVEPKLDGNILERSDDRIYDTDRDRAFIAALRKWSASESAAESDSELGKEWIAKAKGSLETMQITSREELVKQVRAEHEKELAERTMGMSEEESKKFRADNPFYADRVREWSKEELGELFSNTIKKNINEGVVKSAVAQRFLRESGLVDPNQMPEPLENVVDMISNESLEAFENAVFVAVKDENNISGATYIQLFNDTALTEFAKPLQAAMKDKDAGTVRCISMAMTAITRQCSDAFRRQVIANGWSASSKEARELAASMLEIQKAVIGSVVDNLLWMDSPSMKELIDKHTENIKAWKHHGGINQLAVAANIRFVVDAMKGELRNQGVENFVNKDISFLFENAHQNKDVKDLNNLLGRILQTRMDGVAYQAFTWAEQQFYEGTLQRADALVGDREENDSTLHQAFKFAYGRSEAAVKSDADKKVEAGEGKEPQKAEEGKKTDEQILTSLVDNAELGLQSYYDSNKLDTLMRDHGKEIDKYVDEYINNLSANRDDFYHPLVGDNLRAEVKDRLRQIWVHSVTSKCPGRLPNMLDTARWKFWHGVYKLKFRSMEERDREEAIRKKMFTDIDKAWLGVVESKFKSKMDDSVLKYQKFERNLMQACRKHVIAVLENRPKGEKRVVDFSTLTPTEKMRLADGVMAGMGEKFTTFMSEYLHMPVAYDKIAGDSKAMSELAGRLLDMPLQSDADGSAKVLTLPASHPIVTGFDRVIKERDDMVNNWLGDADFIDMKADPPIKRMETAVVDEAVLLLKDAQTGVGRNLSDSEKDLVRALASDLLGHVHDRPYTVAFHVGSSEEFCTAIAKEVKNRAKQLFADPDLLKEIAVFKETCMDPAKNDLLNQLTKPEQTQKREVLGAQMERLVRDTLLFYQDERKEALKKIDPNKTTEKNNAVKELHDKLVDRFKSSVLEAYRLSEFVPDQHTMDGAKLIVRQKNQLRDALRSFGFEVPQIEDFVAGYHSKNVLKDFTEIVERYGTTGADEANMKAEMQKLISGNDRVVGEFVELLANAADKNADEAPFQSAFDELVNEQKTKESTDPNRRKISEHLTLGMFEDVCKALKKDPVLYEMQRAQASLLYAKAKGENVDNQISALEHKIMDYQKGFIKSECLSRAVLAEVDAEMKSLNVKTDSLAEIINDRKEAKKSNSVASKARERNLDQVIGQFKDFKKNEAEKFRNVFQKASESKNSSLDYGLMVKICEESLKEIDKMQQTVLAEVAASKREVEKILFFDTKEGRDLKTSVVRRYGGHLKAPVQFLKDGKPKEFGEQLSKELTETLNELGLLVQGSWLPHILRGDDPQGWPKDAGFLDDANFTNQAVMDSSGKWTTVGKLFEKDADAKIAELTGKLSDVFFDEYMKKKLVLGLAEMVKDKSRLFSKDSVYPILVSYVGTEKEPATDRQIKNLFDDLKKVPLADLPQPCKTLLEFLEYAEKDYYRWFSDASFKRAYKHKQTDRAKELENSLKKSTFDSALNQYISEKNTQYISEKYTNTQEQKKKNSLTEAEMKNAFLKTIDGAMHTLLLKVQAMKQTVGKGTDRTQEPSAKSQVIGGSSVNMFRGN